MIPAPFSAGLHNELAALILQAFSGRTLDLFADAGLEVDLQRVRLVERIGGLRLEITRDKLAGHGDRLTALCLALLAAKRRPMIRTPTFDGSLWLSPTVEEMAAERAGEPDQGDGEGPCGTDDEALPAWLVSSVDRGPVRVSAARTGFESKLPVYTRRCW